MSYEGYLEKLCSNGHYWSCDPPYPAEGADCCRKCGENSVFTWEVDQTNGIEWDENGVVIPHTTGFPFEIAGWEDVWCEDHYGNKYAVKHLLYKIPVE